MEVCVGGRSAWAMREGSTAGNESDPGPVTSTPVGAASQVGVAWQGSLPTTYGNAMQAKALVGCSSGCARMSTLTVTGSSSVHTSLRTVESSLKAAQSAGSAQSTPVP